MSNVSTRNLKASNLQERPEPGKGRKKPIQTRNLTNEQIDRAKDQQNESAAAEKTE